MCGLEVTTAFETDIWPPGLWTHEQKCLVMSQDSSYVHKKWMPLLWVYLLICSLSQALSYIWHKMVKSKMIAKEGSIDYVSHLVLYVVANRHCAGSQFFWCIKFLHWFLNTAQFPETTITWTEKYLQCDNICTWTREAKGMELNSDCTYFDFLFHNSFLCIDTFCLPT
jgi:hypothetical protein